MRISKDGFKLKDTISHFEYIDIVNEIVDNAFFTDDDGNITDYAPQFLSVILPTIFVDHCVEGVELDEDEKKDITKYIEAVCDNKELYKAVTDAIDGVDYIDGNLRYFYNAMEDAEKIINLKLQELSPQNKFLSTLTKFMDMINSKFNGVDVKDFAENLEKLVSVEQVVDEAKSEE